MMTLHETGQSSIAHFYWSTGTRQACGNAGDPIYSTENQITDTQMKDLKNSLKMNCLIND